MSEQDRYIKKTNARVAAIVKKLIQDEREAREKHGIQDALKFIPAQLQELLDRLERELPYDIEESSIDEGNIVLPSPKPGQVPVYIYLYHANGQQLDHWRSMLTPKTLAESAVTRPIYEKEEQIQRFLRGKAHEPFYAYLIVYVDEKAILHEGLHKPEDQLGQSLVRLKDHAVKIENLAGLYHNTLGLFAWVEGTLKKVT